MNMTKFNNEQLQQLQERTMDRLYQAPYKSPLRHRICQRYNAMVTILLERLGENAAINLIDAELYQSFSDAFKDENGCRPGAWPYAMVKQYMDKLYATQ